MPAERSEVQRDICWAYDVCRAQNRATGSDSPWVSFSHIMAHIDASWTDVEDVIAAMANTGIVDIAEEDERPPASVECAYVMWLYGRPNRALKMIDSDPINFGILPY